MAYEWMLGKLLEGKRIWLEVLCTAAHSWLEEFLKLFFAVFAVTQRIFSILHYEGKVVTIRPLVKKPIRYGCQSHSLSASVHKAGKDVVCNFWKRSSLSLLFSVPGPLPLIMIAYISLLYNQCNHIIIRYWQVKCSLWIFAECLTFLTGGKKTNT